jgi:hypothetical protein
MAWGYGGQYVVVVPELDMVVVFASHLEEQGFCAPEHLLAEYILPAAKSSTHLLANPKGTTLLASRVAALATP